MLQRMGYKKTALTAIAVGFAGVCVMWFAGRAGSYGIYLAGAFVSGFSMCMLNTVVNPMLKSLGSNEKRGNQTHSVRHDLQLARRDADTHTRRLPHGKRSVGTLHRQRQPGLVHGHGHIRPRIRGHRLHPHTGTLRNGSGRQGFPAGSTPLSASATSASAWRPSSSMWESKWEYPISPTST